MPVRSHITEIEIFDDETNDKLATVSVRDEGVANVKLHAEAHTANSWAELNHAIAVAIQQVH